MLIPLNWIFIYDTIQKEQKKTDFKNMIIEFVFNKIKQSGGRQNNKCRIKELMYTSCVKVRAAMTKCCYLWNMVQMNQEQNGINFHIAEYSEFSTFFYYFLQSKLSILDALSLYPTGKLTDNQEEKEIN